MGAPELKFQPVPPTAVFSEPGWFIWCGTMLRTDDGQCHLFYSRWRKELGFLAWVTHSEVAYAIARHPLRPYEHRGIALPERGPEFWDGHCTHNPAILAANGRYYLYYMGNRGNREKTEGLNWSHRNAQRIGIAVADSPAGPWTRDEWPLISTTPGFHDALCCANPSVVLRADGGVLMIYKAVGRLGTPPFGGPVVHVVATANSPQGYFHKHPQAIWTSTNTSFPAEDPCLWWDGAGYHAIVKDMGGHFTSDGVSLAHLQSRNGFDWNLADNPLVSRTEYLRSDGGIEHLNALERPQIWLDGDGPAVLFCAASREPTGRRSHSWNVAIPLKRYL